MGPKRRVEGEATETYRTRSGSRVTKMSNAHVAGKVYRALAVVKDLGGHAIALALEDSASRATGRDTTGILTAMLEIVQTLVQVGRGVRRIGIREDKGENTAHFAGSNDVTNNT